ncbi:hypothetical protein ACIQ2D_06925 [Lysinibacillus sp. NPDC097287]|uniref:hypothetical protein n=1 Tax=Lysinibacillus sp. NPDC097287 TaxID=3364144 RepID=UPI0038277FF1
MWKIPLFTMILATMLLGGCNWGDKANEETPMNDLGNDIRQGVDDVEDAVTPDTNNDTYDRDVNGVDKNGTVNDNGVNNNGAVNENGVNNNGTVNENGVVPEVRNPNVNGTNDVIKEDVVEEKVVR